MEQNRESKNISSHKWSTYFEQTTKAIQWWKDNLFNKWCRTIGFLHVKNETLYISNTIFRKLIKMGHRPKCKI